MKIYAVNIATAKVSSHMKLLPIENQIEINKMKSTKDILRKLYSQLLIRKVIKDELSISSDTIAFYKNEYGKPFIKEHTHFEYNISHSGDWIVCATSNKPIGIDIEEICDIDLSIATTLFSKLELHYILDQSLHKQPDAFFEIWTLKESYIKQIGRGLSFDLDNFSMFKDDGFWCVSSLLRTSHLNFYQYCSFPNYKIAVCSEEKSFPNKIIFLNPKDL